MMGLSLVAANAATGSRKKKKKHYLRGLLLRSKETKIYSQVTRLTRNLLLLCSVFLVSVQFTSFWCHTATSWSFCSHLLC